MSSGQRHGNPLLFLALQLCDQNNDDDDEDEDSGAQQTKESFPVLPLLNTKKINTYESLYP